MMKTVWVIFAIDEKNTFPNFFPIGTYSSKENAEKQLEELPVKQYYQLFEFPVDSFFGEITKDGKIKSNLGKLNHFHFENEE